MSDRDRFIAARQARWADLEDLLGQLRLDADGWSRLASQYRAVCADLARAQTLSLPDSEQRYLDGLATRAHNTLYGGRSHRGRELIATVFSGFPRELRAQWRFFLLANLLFYGPFIFGLVSCLLSDTFGATVLSSDQLAQYESMYSDQIGRTAGDDAQMAGFYVHNNVGIAFRCFATGALFGLGPLYFLVYNGLIIGVTLGHLISVGLSYNILTFVCGHSAWELTGIVVSGAAGLRLGWALVATEGRTRAASLRAVGPILFRLIAGAGTMLLIAAAIEGFWSASPLPAPVKWAFALVQVLVVTLWLTLGGRR